MRLITGKVFAPNFVSFHGIGPASFFPSAEWALARTHKVILLLLENLFISQQIGWRSPRQLAIQDTSQRLSCVCFSKTFISFCLQVQVAAEPNPYPTQNKQPTLGFRQPALRATRSTDHV